MQTASQVAHRARVDPFKKFLATFADTGNVTASCMVAGLSRHQIYRRKKKDAEFAEAWEAALEISVDKLEYVARERSVQGVKEPVYYKGKVVGHVYKPSDRLMELLLKAHRPEKFNPVQKLEHSGGVSIDVVQFGSGNPAPMTIEGQSVQSPGIEAPGIDDQGGVDSEGVPPKFAASQNDEGPHVAKFSDSEPE